MSSNSKRPKYSVLIMGITQAGKSTFVEHIKNYANPNYNIDTTLLGNGSVTKTRVPRTFLVESTLPVYEVYYIPTGETISLDSLSAKFDDEEDYREFVMSREKDVGMRTSPQDVNSPTEPVEFQILDTPGTNDTSENDTAHASNIINEMINIRTFNLIVIIISYKNPLTQEQELALEYYANVFKGLHSRIVFLHTHVEYTEIHHTNKVHHANMDLKNKALSKMFRRHDSEVVFDEENFQEYSSFTIDMVSRKRPVINCLIRNTIREILKMATEPPAILDTSRQNIERIRAITHPTKFNDDERRRIKARFQAEAAKMSKVEEVEQADVGGKDLEQINILLIGDVQSGKSSLVETFKLYADSDYVVNTQHITQGNSRIASEKVKVTAFLSNLHTVQIRRLKVSTYGYDVVDLEEEAKTLSEEDFEDLLNLGPKNAETVIIGSNGAKKYRFNIYEGPSLNESDENYEKYIFSIYQTIVESEAQFHQVLFTLAPGSITGARSIIRTFCDIFSDINSLFSFVHTKIVYPKLHIGNKQFQYSMNERQEILQQYTQSTATSYLIDNNLMSNRPVQRGKTMNMIHDILLAAISHPSIELGRSLQASHETTVVYDTDSKVQPEDTVEITKGSPLQRTSFFSGEALDFQATVASAHTILVLGRSQSGKSTLVEHIKCYADSVEAISNLRAMRTPHTVFQSNLPTYEAIQKDNGTILNVTQLADIFSEDDSGFLAYHELLRSSERNFVARVSPPMTSLPQPKTLAYMILDTPGINNSVNDDETITKLVSSHSFNLVLIVVSFWYPLTLELQLALEYYSKILQGLHCNVAFLHTRVDYADHHPHNEDFYRNLKLRNLLLSRIFQDRGSTPRGNARSHMVPKADEMEEHPSFTLELRSDESPIIHSLNRNTIREILYLAASNSPQRIDTSDENMDRIRAIPHPKNFTESQRRKIQESISEEDEKQKILSVADDCLGRSYGLKDTSFHKTRSIYKELVDPATSSGRSFRTTRSLSTTHGKS